MKKRIFSLLLLLMIWMPGKMDAQAADGMGWTEETWAMVTAALASQEDCPVPAAYRLAVRGDDLAAARGLDRRWMHVLLMSTDVARIEENFGRTNAMLICSIHTETGAVRLVSLPAEVSVQIAGLPHSIRLMDVNCFGGPGLAMRTINEQLAMNVTRYCAVNFDAFTQMIDAMGGVQLTLSESEAKALNAAPGEGTLDGEQALAYARLRRQGEEGLRPRKLLTAVLERLQKGDGVDQAFSLIEELLPILDTNLTTADLMDWLFALCEQEGMDAFQARPLSGENLLSGQRAAYHAFIYGEETEP